VSEITVVGAGLAGLVAARELVLQGHTVRVLEASATVGGHIARVEIAGRAVDVGALVLDGAAPAVASLLSRLDAAPRIVRAEPLGWWLSTPSGVHPLPAMHWWGVPAAPLAADSVAIIGQSAAWRGMLDAVLPGPRGADAASLGELVRIRMGAGIADSLVGPVVESHTGRSIDEVLVREVPGLRHFLLQQNSLARAVTTLRLDREENAELTTHEGGVSALVGAIVAELGRFGVEIERDARVDEIVDEGVVVDGELRPGPIVRAAAVVPRPSERSTVVTLVLDSSLVAPGARGAGVLFGLGQPHGVRRVLDISALWPEVYGAGLRGATDAVTILRVEGAEHVTTADALRVVSAAWGDPRIEQAVLGHHSITWDRLAARGETDETDAPECVLASVGEHVVGPGIAAIIEATIDAVARLAPEPPASQGTEHP
jgi:oxygen-dependent protoporphyrinogen oxidase